MVDWSSAYNDGRANAALEAIEQDLSGPAPHPFAAAAWGLIHANRQDLDAAFAAASPVLRQALGVFPELYLAVDRHELRAALDRYVPADGPVTNDPWALYLLAYIADQEDAWPEWDRVAKTMAAQWPDFYGTVWVLDHRFVPLESRHGMTGLFAEGGSLRNSPAGAALARLAEDPADSSAITLEVTTDFLKRFPNDAVALRERAAALRSLDRYPEAEAGFAATQSAWPFGADFLGMAVISHVATLARQQNVDKMLADAERRGRVELADPDAVARRAAAILASALLQDGWLGEMRRRLEPALARWPEDVKLNHLAVRLDLRENLPETALAAARRELAAAPMNADAAVDLVEALQTAGRYDEAIETFELAWRQRRLQTQSLIYQASNAAEAKADLPLARRIQEAGLARFPGSSWIQRGEAYYLSKTGDQLRAYDLIHRNNATFPTNAWSAARLRDYAAAVHGADEAQAAALWLRQLQSDNQVVWTDATSLLDKDPTAREALWQTAREANPTQVWSWEPSFDHLINTQQFDAAGAFLDQAEKLQAHAPSLRAYVARSRVQLLVSRSQVRKSEPDEIAHGFAALDQEHDAGLNLADYLFNLARLYQLAGQPADAGRAMLKYMEIEPEGAGNRMFYVFDIHDGGLLDQTRFQFVWHYLDRSPRDPDRLYEFAERHNRWGGSPLAALWAYDRLREIAPAKLCSFCEAQAYQKLGDSTRLARLHLNAYRVSTSDRYIGWFANARHEAEAGTTQVHFDPKAMRAEILLPSGEVEILEDDLRLGKRTLIQSGAAWVRAAYDAYGNCVRLWGASGAEISMTYDAARHITVMDGTDWGRLEYGYNEAGKITSITVPGIGEMRISYRPDGEIEHVDGDRNISLKVSEANQLLLNLVHPFESGVRSDHIPKLPFADGETDRLRDAVGAASSPEDSARARLVLASRLIERLADHADYSSEAQETLQQLAADAREANASRVLRDAGGQAVALWHDLMLRTRKDGLALPDWQTWTGMRDWI